MCTYFLYVFETRNFRYEQIESGKSKIRTAYVRLGIIRIRTNTFNPYEYVMSGSARIKYVRYVSRTYLSTVLEANLYVSEANLYVSAVRILSVFCLYSTRISFVLTCI